MTFAVSIKCDNAAFEDDPAPEVARILRKLADDIERSGIRTGGNRGPCILHSLRDANGNKVGEAQITSLG